MSFCERYGDPFEGEDLEKLITFLKSLDLDYDRNIQHTIIIEDDDRMIASASCHGNVLKCVGVSPSYQGQNLMGSLMTHMIGYFFEKGITHYFGFTKPKNKEIFEKLGLYPVAETENILLMENRKNGLQKYIEKLKKETGKAEEFKEPNFQGEGIAAIIANCNPFTNGHRFLIETAARKCRWLHVFILSAEQDFITSGQRYDLVKKGTEDLSNVILHRTSDYLISPVVFPTYFIKDKAHAYEMNCMLDLKIFTDYIAPALGITTRFAGTEPVCKVTAAYNDCMRKVLPEHGMRFEEISRIESDGQLISASYVRDCFKKGQLELVRDMLPESTYIFLEEKASDC